MRELGYVEGQNFTMDYIDLQGRPERYPDAMQQLVDRKADVIIAYGPEDSLKAATAATKTIPIAMAAIDYDPFALGYVTSLARPTGNVTGVFLEQIELAVKRLQLVKEAIPAIGRATVFWDRHSADQWRATRDNASKLVSISLASNFMTILTTTHAPWRRRRRSIGAFYLSRPRHCSRVTASGSCSSRC